MTLWFKVFAIICALLLSACTTKDFKVVDALRVGMAKEEARSTVASFSFECERNVERPTTGWESDGTYPDLAHIARVTEERIQKKISTAEYYPVGHGLLGFGQLFLFYDENGLLVHFFRHQIN